MKKSLLFVLLGIVFLSPVALAQNATTILDHTSAKLKNGGGIQANFDATVFQNKKSTGTTSGSIDVQGKKFKVTSSSMTTWFDGTHQWTLLAGSDEVNLSKPTEAEIQSINPYAFVDLYKNGYKCSLKSATHNGKTCHEVRLLAKNKAKASIKEMLLTIDRTTYMPLCIRLLQKDGKWLRLTIKQITQGKQWPDDHFRFSEKDYPNVELIDLR